MTESNDVKMARLEEKVNNLGATMDKGLREANTSLRNIEQKLESITVLYLAKDEYYRDQNAIEKAKEVAQATAKANRDPWLKVGFNLLQNALSFITLGLILYILTNGASIFG